MPACPLDRKKQIGAKHADDPQCPPEVDASRESELQKAAEDTLFNATNQQKRAAPERAERDHLGSGERNSTKCSHRPMQAPYQRESARNPAARPEREFATLRGPLRL